MSSLETAVGPLQMAAATAGVPLVDVPPQRQAAAVVVADVACRLGRCRLETAHRARRSLRLLLSRGLWLLGDPPTGVPAGESQTGMLADEGRRLDWEEYFQQAGHWCSSQQVDPADTLRLVADCLSGDQDAFGILAEVARDVADSWSPGM